ncbi:MAG: glycosyl transferase, partial [Eubacterium sp.]|nr:glycosyl transferase [Eubacterium sp.]
MIGTEMIKGQGLGNQLFVYVTARAIATEKGCEFGILNPEQFGNNIHSSNGMYFMDIDCGKVISPNDKDKMHIWNDDDTRIYLGTSKSDMENGIYVSGPDDSIHDI